MAYEVESGKRFRRALFAFESARNKGDEAAGWKELVKACRTAVQPAGLGGDEHAAFCYVVHRWSYKATALMADHFRQAARG